jgi:alpha-glucosidase
MKENSYPKRFFLLIFTLIFLYLQSFSQDATNAIVISLKNKQYISIQSCTNRIFRVRVSDKNDFPQTLMERYGILKTDWDLVKVSSKSEKGKQFLQTSNYQIIIDEKTGDISVNDLKGKPIVSNIHVNKNQSINKELAESLQNYFGNEKSGGGIIGDKNYTGIATDSAKNVKISASSVLEISINPNERFYGAGSASRSQVQHRGSALKIWATYQKSEAPIPFIMSTQGWGIFNNSTWLNFFDIGRFKSDKLYCYNTNSEMDFYLILGDNMPDVLSKYTSITGKPYLLPKYAYGFAFGSNILENQFNVLDNAVGFRSEKIPCDIYWLEPQWMAKNYDSSTKKDWNESRFQADFSWLPDPKDVKKTNMYLSKMKDLGFKTVLWLNAEHDLTVEEEDHLSEKNGKPQSGQEHWFPHLLKFVDQGVAGFKLDPGTTLDEHPYRKYFNGKTDAEMHNLNQILPQKQMYTTLRKHTGLRSFHHYCGGYAGSSHWGAATVGDNGGNVKSLYDVINQSFSGNPNIAVDMLEDVPDKAQGIHYAFFTPWVQLNSWAWLLHPWYYNEHDKEMFRYYAQLRYSLIPYIYSAAINSSLTGQPIVWPMALAYPNDKHFENTLHQYMFGENLLVGAYTDSVYLPEGNWIDYWTNQKFAGQQSVKCKVPENRGGPLFIKAGAIIPYQKQMQYIGEHPLDTLIMKVYPQKQSSYILIEDDGKSFDFEKGMIASTRFECNAGTDKIELIIQPTEGKYEGMIGSRAYQVEVFMKEVPKSVQINGQKTDNWKFEQSGKLIIQLPKQNAINKQVITIL